MKGPDMPSVPTIDDHLLPSALVELLGGALDLAIRLSVIANAQGVRVMSQVLMQGLVL
jgi:hypothetical protein